MGNVHHFPFTTFYIKNGGGGNLSHVLNNFLYLVKYPVLFRLIQVKRSLRDFPEVGFCK